MFGLFLLSCFTRKAVQRVVKSGALGFSSHFLSTWKQACSSTLVYLTPHLGSVLKENIFQSFKFHANSAHEENNQQ